MRKFRTLIAVVAVAALGLGQAMDAAGAGSPAASARERAVREAREAKGRDGPLALQAHLAKKRAAAGAADIGEDGIVPSDLECRSRGTTDEPPKRLLPNVLLDCDTILPNNEPHIAVDPLDPNHLVASSNDYDQCCDAFYTSFTGGRNWRVGDMSVESHGRTGSDPVTTFDRKHDTIIHSSLNFRNNGCDGDVVASIWEDGGLHWNTVREVADGVDCDLVFHDKEWITTDNNPASPHYGTTYVTWTAFYSDPDGNFLQSPIFESHSTDGGFTWTPIQEISGQNPQLCLFVNNDRPGACNSNQFSVPSVAPDGTVYVTFINDQNVALWEPGEFFDDQYLMVKSEDGGATWSDPEFVVGLDDGSRDMPINVDGRQTLTNYQVRAPFTQGFVADPTQNGRLYLVFADNRNGVHDSDDPQTNLDVFLMVKPSEAGPWTGPIPVSAHESGIQNDQWFPWVDVNPTNGEVGIIYHDRSYHKRLRAYNTTLAVGPAGGAGPWGEAREERVSTADSHPRKSVFFRAHANGCESCATFHGDYNSIAYDSEGRAHITWTDMRDYYPPLDRYLQFIYYARR